MTDIKEYNADARRLNDALGAVESQFTWRVRGWDYANEVKYALPWTAEQIEEWKQYSDDNPPTPEESRAIEMRHFTIRAATKKRYEKGRIFILIHNSRDLFEDSLIDSVTILNLTANEELQHVLEEKT